MYKVSKSQVTGKENQSIRSGGEAVCEIRSRKNSRGKPGKESSTEKSVAMQRLGLNLPDREHNKSVKAVKWAEIWHIQEKSRRLVLLEHNEERKN